MGREEVNEHTRNVSPQICWLTYVCAILAMVGVFKYPVSPYDWYLNGFVAHIAATFVVFLFSFVSGNSSLYDPAWYIFPPFICLFWICASEEPITPRSYTTLTLVTLWASRFALQWPWEGFTSGL